MNQAILPELAPIDGTCVRLLASVLSAGEAYLAIAGGADIIDAKDPRQGALGAVDDATLRAIRAVVPTSIPLSATTGDIPVSEVARIVNEVQRIADAGADIVKIGFFGGDDAAPLLASLAALQNVERYAFGRRVAVLFADAAPRYDLIQTLPTAGFFGVMLDTAQKSSGSLFDVIEERELKAFVHHARKVGMLVGLAGALRLRHIHGVMALAPDIVGFRGALCKGGSRVDAIDPEAVAEIRTALACRLEMV